MDRLEQQGTRRDVCALGHGVCSAYDARGYLPDDAFLHTPTDLKVTI